MRGERGEEEEEDLEGDDEEDVGGEQPGGEALVVVDGGGQRGELGRRHQGQQLAVAVNGLGVVLGTEGRGRRGGGDEEGGSRYAE